MPGKVAKIGTFSDWVGLFDDWRKEIGVNTDEIAPSSLTLCMARSRPMKFSSAHSRAVASGRTSAKFQRSRCATQCST